MREVKLKVWCLEAKLPSFWYLLPWQQVRPFEFNELCQLAGGPVSI